MNSLSVPLFTMNTLAFSRIYYLLRDLSRYIFDIFWITIYFLSFSLYHCKYTICFAILLRINYLFCNFIMNSISISRFHSKFIIYFGNLLWLHYLFRDFAMSSQSVSRNLFSMNPLFSSQNQYEFTICFLNSVTLNRLFSPNHYKFTIFFANPPWIHFFFREITVNSVSFSRFHYEYTIYFGNLE